MGTARGKLGDVVFYRTGGEQRFRTRVRPTNRRTNAQLLQRVVVATAVKAYSNFVEVCNHAFQNFEGALKNQERYMRLNIKMLREIALQNIESWSPIRFSSTNYGNWLPKDATVTVVNPYIISEGDLPSPQLKFIELSTTTGASFLEIDKSLSSITYNDVIDALGLNEGDQLTFVMQRCLTNGVVIMTDIARVILKPRTAHMNQQIFTLESSGSASSKYVINDPNKENYGDIYFSENIINDNQTRQIYVYPKGWNAGQVNSFGVIVSRYENNMWRRSTSQMLVDELDTNIAPLQSAMSSYLMAETSSLYLNQAQRTDQLGNPIVLSMDQALNEQKAAEIEEEMTADDEEIQEEIERTTSRKSKK